MPESQHTFIPRSPNYSWSEGILKNSRDCWFCTLVTKNIQLWKIKQVVTCFSVNECFLTTGGWIGSSINHSHSKSLEHLLPTRVCLLCFLANYLNFSLKGQKFWLEKLLKVIFVDKSGGMAIIQRFFPKMECEKRRKSTEQQAKSVSDLFQKQDLSMFFTSVVLSNVFSARESGRVVVI